MNEPLNCIMLIDDDEDDNFFHRIVVEESGLAKSIKISETAVEALEWFQSAGNLPPELLFLDLNLPKMNGWEFVEELEKLNLSQRPVIIMLTTSYSPFDKQKAAQFKINGFET